MFGQRRAPETLRPLRRLLFRHEWVAAIQQARTAAQGRTLPSIET